MEIEIDFGNDGFKIKATVSTEGDRWCVFAGEFALMPVGFGFTISDAVSDFKRQVFNTPPPKRK